MNPSPSSLSYSVNASEHVSSFTNLSSITEAFDVGDFDKKVYYLYCIKSLLKDFNVRIW